MTNTIESTLRDRIRTRRGRSHNDRQFDIPAAGIIPPEMVMEIQALAIDAKSGDVAARATLYEVLRHRLERLGQVLRPWPNTYDQTGIWDRDDVNQEGWLVFNDLLQSWEPHVPFVKYLLARYPWRVRDRVLRGIGKRLPPLGDVRVPEYLLAVSVYAGEDEQPEPALMASGLLEELIEQHNQDTDLTALRSPDRQPGKSNPSMNTSESDKKPA